MNYKRIIPCLLFDGKGLIKTKQFKNPEYIGDPINAIKIFNDKEVDEIIFIDIFATKERRQPNFIQIEEFTSECFVPFSYGGGIQSYTDIEKLIKCGAEKVIVNSMIFKNIEDIKLAIKNFGSQCVVASVDLKKNIFGKYKVFSYSGFNTKMDPIDFCLYLANDIKVGEIFLNSVNNEGMWCGFENQLTNLINKSVQVPMILSGGAGSLDHIKQAFFVNNFSAVALGSMCVYQKKNGGILINYPNRDQIFKI